MRKERERERDAFKASKNLLLSLHVLVHFESKHLACDASNHGIGAVLSHRFADDSEKPIGFTSRTLEKRYPKVEKRSTMCFWS